MNDDKETVPIGDVEQLTQSIKKLVTIVDRVEDKKYLQMIAHPRKFLFYSFLQGVFIALGSSIGVVLVFTIIAYILKTLQYIPLVGDFTGQVLPFLHK